MAIPTRGRGLVRKQRGLEALVSNPSCIAINTNTPTRASAPTTTHDDDDGLIYQGDFFGPKKSDSLRLVCLNLNNFPVDIEEPKEVSLFQVILEHGIDILLMQELGLHWSNLSKSKQWRTRVDKYLNPKCTKTRCSHNVHDTTGTRIQAGGTGILSHDKISHFAMGTGCDKAKLGRWTWARYRGKNGMVLRVVSVYRPCDSSGGERTAWSQHKAYFNDNNDDRDPRDAFLEDLKTEIQEWTQVGDQIIVGGDLNDEIRGPSIKAYFEDLGMHNLIFQKHDETLAPTTFFRNKKGKVMDGMWGTANISAVKCGYLEPCDFPGDHSAIWVDISYNCALGHNPPLPSNPDANRLQLDQPKTVKKYTQAYKAEVQKHSLPARQFNLERTTTVGRPLLPHQQQEAIEIDVIKTKAMLRAHRKCRRIYLGKVSFSEEVDVPKCKLIFWQTAIRRRKGLAVSSNLWRRRKKKAKVELRMGDLSLEDLEVQLKAARSAYRKAKKDHVSKREAFRKTFEPKVRDRLTRHEQARKLGRVAKAINGKLESLQVKVIEHNGTTCDTKARIEEVLLPVNKAKVHSSESTAFLTEPLVGAFGYQGNEPLENEVLQGTYVPPPETSRYAKLFLKHCIRPPNMPCGESQVSTADHCKGWKRAKERTSGGRSRIIFAMYKAEAEDSLLAALDASQRSLAYATGFTYPRWKQGLDIQLLKRSGKIGATSLRTISCTEPDQNMNNKKIGREAMWNGERAKALARDNLGGRKGMRAVEVNQNWTLANDLIRGRRARAVIISNDAKGCFDRIAHVVAILALRRLGIPRPAIMSMIHTIQQMQHYIRTAFGESDQSYGPNPSGPPPQGLIQGNGAAPAAWTAITAILVDCMKSEGFGYEAWAPISQRAMTLVCFGFVDDTDLILNSSDPTATAEDLICDAQLALSTWEGLISATGGALAPEKSYWYLVDVGPDGKYLPKSKQPGDLFLRNQGRPEVIDRLEVTEARETLGIWSRPDGLMKDEVEALKQKALKWADAVRTKRINPTEAWYSVNHTIMKTIEYPLAATSISPSDMQDIMRPILQAALPKARIQRHFPRKLVYGTLQSEGFSVYDPSITQLIEHVHSIVRHSHMDSPSNDLHIQNMELVQCYVGTEKPFWEMPYSDYGPLAPRGWMAFTWKELAATSLSLRGPLATAKPNRQGETTISETWVARGLEVSLRMQLNEVRLHLGLTYVSELCTAAGTHVHIDVWNCVRGSTTLPSLSWPNIKAPGRNAKAAWQSMLRSLFIAPGHSYRQLAQPLGNWLHPQDDTWTWWLCPASDTMWERRQNSEWHTWSALPRRYQHRRYTHSGRSSQPLPPDCHRATVRTSGRTLRLLDIGEFIPSTLPQVPTTLKAALAALPQSCQWAIQHTSFEDDGATVAQAIVQDLAVAVSDGSLRYTLGTAAFVIEGSNPTNHVLGYNQVPGPVEEGDSLRCELAGLYAIVTVVNCICSFHQVTQGSITIACDNTSSLKPTALEYLPHPRHKNLDLMQALWKSLAESPITWKPVHVYGHQDKKVKDSHRRLSDLNCQMDALAKQYWAFLFHRLPTLEAPHLPIHNEGWTVWNGNVKVSSPNKAALYGLIMDPITQMWWVRHDRFPLAAKDTIDWQACAEGVPALKPSRRRWITKHASANCGVGTTLVKWKYQDDDKCPRCNAPEDTTHVLRCQGAGANDVWNESMAKLTEYLVESKTHPDIQHALVNNLHRWRRGLTPCDDFQDAQITESTKAQSLIGWKNLLEGLLCKQWRQLQQRHYNSSRTRKSSKKWIKGLFTRLHNLAWNQWKHRNDIKHRVRRSRQERMNHKMNQEICRLYQQGSQDLHPSERQHFRWSIVTLLQKPNGTKRHWLKNVVAARRRQARRLARNPELEVTTPEQALLLKWMQTNRPR